MSRIIGYSLAVLTLVITFTVSNISWKNEAYANEAVKAKNEIEFLAGKLSSKDRDVRQEAVVLLGQLQSAEALPILVKSLKKDPEWLVREKAAYALGLYSNAASIKALTKALNEDVVSYVRSASAKSLGKIKSTESVGSLTTLIKARTELDWRVRLVIVKLLGEIKSDSAIKALEGLVKEEQSPDVKAEAQKQLELARS
ncbi:MAG: HEAT repeat domain-containing protein [Methyloligellaceae bacterium]